MFPENLCWIKTSMVQVGSECYDVEDTAYSCDLAYFIGTSSLYHCDPAKWIGSFQCWNWICQHWISDWKSGYVKTFFYMIWLITSTMINRKMYKTLLLNKIQLVPAFSRCYCYCETLILAGKQFCVKGIVYSEPNLYRGEACLYWKKKKNACSRK